jgi:hypothetical protein
VALTIGERSLVAARHLRPEFRPCKLFNHAVPQLATVSFVGWTQQREAKPPNLALIKPVQTARAGFGATSWPRWNRRHRENSFAVQRVPGSPADASAVNSRAGIPVTIAGMNEPVRTRQTVAIVCIATSLVLSAVVFTILVFTTR